MARLHTSAAKAVKQIERRDARGAEQYRAELSYFHYKQRVVLPMSPSAKAMHYVGQPTWCCEQAFLMLGMEHDTECPRAHAHA